MTSKRYPIEPLAEALGVTLGRIGGYQPDAPTEGLAALARSIGANRALLDRNARRARGDACPTCDDVGLVLDDQDVASPCPTCKGRP